MNPVGKYYKTQSELIYCYAVDGLFNCSYECICVGDNYIRTMHYIHVESFSRSTRKSFMKAYSRTIERLNEIVTIV